MKDDPELQMNDDSMDDRTYPPKRKRMDSDSNRLLPAIIIVLLAIIFAGGIYYFITRRSTEGDTTLQSKIAALEEKVAGLEKQIADLPGKSAPGVPDPSLLRQVEGLSRKVEALEKRSEPTAELKAKPSAPKPPVTAQKRYHTVQKGETLFKISKKYGITVEELRKLNDLSRGEPVRTGQKLLISAER
jgi:LysM repeat protein